MRTTVTIAGMTTSHCRRAIFTALAGVRGVRSADVALGRAIVEHERSATLDAIRAAIADVGYEVTDSVTDTRVLPQLP